MHTLQKPDLRDGVTLAEAAGEVERLLSDPQFQISDRNRKFLRYISVDRPASTRKTTAAIAIDVFGRQPTFDSRLDPIVRVEASRLRHALNEYYATAGRDAAIRVAVPPGQHTVVFTRGLYSDTPEPILLLPSVGERAPFTGNTTESSVRSQFARFVIFVFAGAGFTHLLMELLRRW